MSGIIAFESLTPDTLAKACQSAMDACDRAILELVAVPDSARTFANTMFALEDARDVVGHASGMYAFMAYVSADDALREGAREWDAKLDKYNVDLSFREDLYQAVKAFSQTNEAQALTGEARRLLDFELRDYRRNGFELPREKRSRVQELFNQLVELGTAFRNAIDDWDEGILVSRADLSGLPDAFVDSLKTVADAAETRYRVSLDYPEYFPFMSNAESETLRRELFLKEQTRAGTANVERLETAIRVRTEIATLLGYDSWAAYVVEERMSKRRQNVDSFLAELNPKVQAKADRDFVELQALKQSHAGSGTVNIWDWRFYHNRLMKTRYAVNEFEVAEYFPLEAVLEGLFRVTGAVLRVVYRAVPGAAKWNEDVRAFDILNADGNEPIARFYMDLHPRPNKYGHAAAFTLQRGRVLGDGSYQMPVSAIVANFTKPTGEQPSLLRHSEVETLFHEFGHILHQTLTRATFGRFSGTATERDFVEAPSQMLEHWVWDADVLRSFSWHFRTGEPLPELLLQSMLAAKHASSGIMYLRQMYFAMLDFAYHSPGFDGNTTAETERLHGVTGFPYTPGTHFQSGFGHLFGYDAGYYGYLWSQVFGDDMYTRFALSGPLDAATGAEYRRKVLERGGSVDGGVMVRDFLGREPNNEAFLRDIGLT
jgi:thimet oligopeptidase